MVFPKETTIKVLAQILFTLCLPRKRELKNFQALATGSVRYLLYPCTSSFRIITQLLEVIANQQRIINTHDTNSPYEDPTLEHTIHDLPANLFGAPKISWADQTDVKEETGFQVSKNFRVKRSISRPYYKKRL